MTRHAARTVSTFLFVVAAFVTLAYRNERIADGIRDEAYKNCILRIHNVERTNTTWDALAAIERDNPYKDTSPTTISRRLTVYEQSKLTPPECKR